MPRRRPEPGPRPGGSAWPWQATRGHGGARGKLGWTGHPHHPQRPAPPGIGPDPGRPLFSPSSAPAPPAAPYPEPQTRHLRSVRTSRRFRQLATPLWRRPRHTLQYEPFPLARGREGEAGRAGTPRSGAQSVPAPAASPGMPGAVGRRSHCMLGNEVFYRRSGLPVPMPPWASGKCGPQPLTSPSAQMLYPSIPYEPKSLLPAFSVA